MATCSNGEIPGDMIHADFPSHLGVAVGQEPAHVWLPTRLSGPGKAGTTPLSPTSVSPAPL